MTAATPDTAETVMLAADAITVATGLDRDTVLKCAWRVAAHGPPDARNALDLAKRTKKIKRTFGLSQHEHEACALLAFTHGAGALAEALVVAERARISTREAAS